MAPVNPPVLITVALVADPPWVIDVVMLPFRPRVFGPRAEVGVEAQMPFDGIVIWKMPP